MLNAMFKLNFNMLWHIAICYGIPCTVGRYSNVTYSTYSHCKYCNFTVTSL